MFQSTGDLPGSGINPMSPALAGRFFTTESPGKPLLFFKSLKYSIYFHNLKTAIEISSTIEKMIRYYKVESSRDDHIYYNHP